MADILHFDDLIEHAEFHEDEFGDDWFRYYTKHFGAESESHIANEHNDKHEKLPNHDHFNLTTVQIFVLATNSDLALNNSFQIQETADYSYLEMVSTFVGNDIFQPPIFA